MSNKKLCLQYLGCFKSSCDKVFSSLILANRYSISFLFIYTFCGVGRRQVQPWRHPRRRLSKKSCKNDNQPFLNFATSIIGMMDELGNKQSVEMPNLCLDCWIKISRASLFTLEELSSYKSGGKGARHSTEVVFALSTQPSWARI